MTREDIHKEVDEWLTKMGFQNEITLKWGSFTFQINFEDGKEVLRIKERETEKKFKK